MKHLLIIGALLTFTSCGGDAAEEVDETTPVKDEAQTELKQIQDENVEIEQLDGELDSLLNEIESL